MSVAGANMQWSHFVRPSCSQKRKNTAFEIVLRLEVLGDFQFPVKMLLEVVYTPCQKRSHVWGSEVNGGRDTSVGNGKNFEKQAQPSKG